MAVLFNKFEFRNLNGIVAEVLLEAPIGTKILDLKVAPNSDASVPPLSVANVASLKLTVIADPDDHAPDIETIDLSHATPYPVYVTSFAARSGIGHIEGELSGDASYRRLNFQNYQTRLTNDTV